MIRGRWKGSEAQGPSAHVVRWVPGSGLVRCTHSTRVASLCPCASSGAGPGPAQPEAHLPVWCLDTHPAWLRPVQSLMLAKAKECWEQEHEEREAEKKRYLAERIPALQTRGLSLSALQVWGWAGDGVWVGGWQVGWGWGVGSGGRGAPTGDQDGGAGQPREPSRQVGSSLGRPLLQKGPGFPCRWL